MEEEKSKVKTMIINIFIVTVIIVTSLFLHAKYVGTKGVVVREYRLTSNKIPSSFSGDKIIYFSDLLYGSTVSISDVKKIVEEINLYKPDIVIFGGDLFAPLYKVKDKDEKELIKELSKIDSNLGKYASLGSNDKDKSKDILSKSGFLVDNNKDYLVYDKSNTPMCLTTVGSLVSSAYKFDDIFKCENLYNIVVSHEADIFDKIKNNNIDVLLSGNSLGGEINVPFLGGLFKFNGSRKYYKSHYKVDNIDIYVSNGLGTKKIFLREFNKPSITLFRLKSMN